MKLEGMHHITMITGDARGNVAFYADTLGLRLAKKTVNFDAPDAYHLYFGDEAGSPGSILTWFEFAGARPGRAGAGMIHTIQLGVASGAALDFWAQRLREYGAERAGVELQGAGGVTRDHRDVVQALELHWRSSWGSVQGDHRSGEGEPGPRVGCGR